jgi:hypothetical protein
MSLTYSKATNKTNSNDPAVTLAPYHENDGALLARWPFLSKPGAQGPNQIAGTLEEQYARALRPRRTPTQRLKRFVKRTVRHLLVAELPEVVRLLIRQELASRNGQGVGKR